MFEGEGLPRCSPGSLLRSRAHTLRLVRFGALPWQPRPKVVNPHLVCCNDPRQVAPHERRENLGLHAFPERLAAGVLTDKLRIVGVTEL